MNHLIILNRNTKMISFSKAAFKACRPSMKLMPIVQKLPLMNQTPKRSFGAMDIIDSSLMEHHFTSEMKF